MLDGRYRGESDAVRALAGEVVTGWVDVKFELDALGRQIWVSAFGGKRYVTEPADQPEPVQWVNDQPPF